LPKSGFGRERGEGSVASAADFGVVVGADVEEIV